MNGVSPQTGEPLLVGGPMVTVPALVAALRRRRQVWLASSAAGLLLALMFSLVSPPAYSATTTLLLRHPGQSDPSRAMATDAELLRTTTVAQGTVDDLDLRLSARDFLSEYTVTPLSDELVSVTVTGPTASEAVRRATTLAEVFLTFRSDEVKRDLQVALDTLDERAEALTSELKTVSDRINEVSSRTAGGGDAAVRGLGDLLTRRTSIGEELGGLRARMEEITRDANVVVDKSRVIDPATEDERSPLMALAANLAAGLVGGLGVGAGLVLVREVAFERANRREEFAAAFGAPVAVSVGTRLGGPSWVQRHLFQRQQVKRRPEVAKMVTHLRTCLPGGESSGSALAVVSVDSDAPAALSVALLALDLAEDGNKVLLADLTSRCHLAGLFGVPADTTAQLRHEEDSTLTLAFPLRGALAPPDGPAPGLEEHPPGEHDVVLALASPEPDVGAEFLRGWAKKAVGVVTSGRSTPATLVSTSEMLRRAGVEVDSLILVGADPGDDTLGVGSTPEASFPAPQRRLHAHVDDSPSAVLSEELGADDGDLRLAPEHQHFQDEIRALQAELDDSLNEQKELRDRLVAEIERLRGERAELAHGHHELQRLEDDIHRLEDERRVAQRAVDDKTQARDHLAKELQRLATQKVAEERALSAQSHARTRLSEDIDRLETRRSELLQGVELGSRTHQELIAEVERLEDRRAAAEGAEHARTRTREQLEADVRRLTEEQQALIESIDAWRADAEHTHNEHEEARERLEAELRHLEEERERIAHWVELQWAEANRALNEHMETKQALAVEVERLRNQQAGLEQALVTSVDDRPTETSAAIVEARPQAEG